ncbi:hypothetical protein BH23ACT10_BH23ACT10_12190 [soil metagenome]
MTSVVVGCVASPSAVITGTAVLPCARAETSTTKNTALAGGSLAGPVGAFVALPVAALISATIANYARSHEVVYNFADADADDEPMR